MTRTLFLDVQRPIQDVTQETDLIDIPLEWYEAVSKACAASMTDAFEIPEPRLMRIKKEARELEDELADWGATEQAPISFQPDWRMYQQRMR
jgi:hypothetical protein